MSVLPQWWRAHFLWSEFGLSVVIAALFYGWLERWGGAAHVDAILHSNRAAVYGTIASIFGSLLGFVITAISIVLGFASHERLSIVKESKHYPQLWKVFMAATRCLGAATIVALGGLVFDTAPEPFHLILEICFWVWLLAVLRVWRCLWVLERIIEVVTA